MALKNLKSLSDLAKAATGKRGKEILVVPVDDVVSKVQVRKRFRKIEELAATILTDGQQSPIIVSPKNEHGKYVIQKGERRWRACKHAGIETIELIINDQELNPLDETAGELIENIQRDDLTPMEIALALNKFVEDGWSQRKIGERIGKSVSFVSTHLSLLKLPMCVQELYEHDMCSDIETLNNLRLLFDLDESRCQTVCSAALSDGISRKQSREYLTDAKVALLKLPDCVQDVYEKGLCTDVDTLKNLGLLFDVDENRCRTVCAVALTDGISSKQSLEILNDAKRVKEDIHNSGSTEHRGMDQNITHTGVELGSESGSESGSAPETNPDLSSGVVTPSPKSKEWKNARAENLIFTVSVELDGEMKRGIIMTERVSLSPAMACVKILDNSGKEKHVMVPVSDIQLLAIEG
ncbi:ParB/RepB/Spo0J family partition protein [Escherichia coli]|uniref:ParB/RepB/Spo0J family partition protein n=1 Tax=Edwardsiella tarda TaxID=636 RepID=UPI00351C6632|nr:ParB/RepB/Spo0J family partition protein [Escherichia coli]